MSKQLMQEQNAKRGISAFDLRCIAIATMLIDHIGAYFFPEHLWMRYVGRFAFPIYCFLIAEGYVYTHSVKKYMGRLLVLALVSEVPFDLLWYGKPFFIWHQNVFFTLLLGLVCICAIDRLQIRWQVWLTIVAVGLFSQLVVQSDYGIFGIAMIVSFYLFRTNAWGRFLAIVVINVILYGGVQSAAVFALVPVHFYGGRKGPSAKWFFYAFYPVHLLLLYLIGRYLIYVN